MTIEFAVAVQPHFAGAGVEYLTKEVFATYDEAAQYAKKFQHECEPTIFVIVNRQYAFYCERSAVKNEPYKVYNLKFFEGGLVETTVWWEDFLKNPIKFLHLGKAL